MHRRLVLVELGVRVVLDERGERLGHARGRRRPRRACSVSASTWRATAHDVLVVRAARSPQSAVHASTASRICAVDGFIDWPPATTCCTPRLVSRRRTPSPTPTATTAVVTAGATRQPRSRSATTSASRTHRSSSTCSIRSVTRIVCGRPASMPASTAAPMSLVCTWQFQSPSPPTTTIESPIAPHASRNAGDRLVVGVEEVHDLVAQARRRRRPRGARRPTAGVVDELGLGDRPAVDDFEQRVEQQREALAARVDDAGLAQAPAAARACARPRRARRRAPRSSTSTSVGAVERLDRLRRSRARR